MGPLDHPLAQRFQSGPEDMRSRCRKKRCFDALLAAHGSTDQPGVLLDLSPTGLLLKWALVFFFPNKAEAEFPSSTPYDGRCKAGVMNWGLSKP